MIPATVPAADLIGRHVTCGHSRTTWTITEAHDDPGAFLRVTSPKGITVSKTRTEVTLTDVKEAK